MLGFRLVEEKVGKWGERGGHCKISSGDNRGANWF